MQYKQEDTHWINQYNSHRIKLRMMHPDYIHIR